MAAGLGLGLCGCAVAQQQQQAPVQPAHALQLRLVGTLLRPAPHPSLALVSVDGGAAQAFAVGERIAPGWVISSASADEIRLRSSGGQSSRIAIGHNEVQPMAQAESAAAAPKLHSVRVSDLPNPMMIQAAQDEFNLPAND